MATATNATGRCTDNTSPYAHTRIFFAAHATCDHTFGSRAWRFSVCLEKSHFIIGRVFVECSFDPFPPIFSSPPTTPTPLTGIRLNPCATPLWGGPSGHLADPTPNTGYGPKFCIDVSSEHTPINLPSRNMGFQQEYDTTITASEDLNLRRHSGASSSSQHTAASTVPTLLKLGSFGTGLTKVSADCDSFASRTSIKETCAGVDRETVVSSLFGSVSKGRRDRDQNVVQTLREGQNLHKLLERKAEVAVRGEKKAQQRLRSWGRRGGQTLGKEKFWYGFLWDQSGVRIPTITTTTFSYIKRSRWADQAQRDKNQACMKNWHWGKGSSEEDHARKCQELQEFTENSVAKKQIEQDKARTDELSLHQDSNPTTVTQLLTQIRDLQNKVNSSSDANEFYDPETASSSGATHVPESNRLTILSPQNTCLALRFWIAVHGTHGIWYGYLQETFFERSNCSRRTILSPLWKFKEFGILLLQELRSGNVGSIMESCERVRRDPQSSSIPTPRFHQSLGTLNHVESHWWNLFSQWYDGLSEIFRISELNPANISWLNGISKGGKSTSRLEYVLKSVDPHLSKHWNKEFEIAKSIDELMTSRSISERTDFTDHDMLDAMIAFALEKTSRQACSNIRKRVSFEEQRAQKYDRFLRGRQIAYMIYEHFRATRSLWCGTRTLKFVQYDVCRMTTSKISTVRWDQALLSASEMPSDVILEGLYKSQLQDSVQLQRLCSASDSLGFVRPRNCSKQRKNKLYSRLKTSVKLHIDQMMRTRNFRVRNEVVERGSVRKESLRWEESGEVFSVEGTWTMFQRRLM